MNGVISRRTRSLAVVVLLAVGCGERSVVPSADVARSSLEKALTAWRDGRPSGVVEGAEPPVQAVDARWQAGRKLSAFEVTGESPGSGDKRFDVRLTFAAPAATEEARFVVVGLGPVLVYGEEDFARVLNMEDNPSPTKSKPKGRPR